MSEYVGVCLGASTVTFVRLVKSGNGLQVGEVLSVPHFGEPQLVFLDNLYNFNPQFHPIAITGRKFRKSINLPSISEPEATELAFNFVNKNLDDYSAIASLGGETFMVYTLDDERKISNVITKNQCASGTGEFFLQQISRMDLAIEDACIMSNDANPHKVTGRCSVFCKSDCTHALNKGVPKSEVTAGLALMMAEKVEELLKKVRHGKVMVVGGVTRNQLFMRFLNEKMPYLVVPAEAVYFEALGAALYAAENNSYRHRDYDNIISTNNSSFVFHKPLKDYISHVSFKTMERGTASDGDRCILGLDVGSTTTKAVIIRLDDNKILGSVYIYTHGDPVRASRKCYSELLNQIPQNIEIIGLGTTGSGRHIAGLHALTGGIINEIVAHATAAVYFDSDVDTIFEIGGQDAKYTYIVNRVPADYAMNEACSAGTGSFIEEAANETLGVKVQEIEKIAFAAEEPPNFSDQCAAFISSDIKTAQHEGISRDNIIAGLVYSICLNYVNRVKGNRAIGSKVFMQGGVCYNKSIPVAMAALTGVDIIVPPEPGLMGAFGVALEIKEKLSLGILDEKIFDLSELSKREAIYKNPFICMGGREKCDLKCTINMMEIQGKKYPFGGSCNKYYNLLNDKDIEIEKFDFVRIRQDLMFNKYAPNIPLASDAGSVGINQSFHTLTLYPLFYNFFTGLGYKVVMPDSVNESGLEREITSLCYPAQVSLCLFDNLLEKNTDFIFVPEIFEMEVEGEKDQRLDFNCTCVFVSGEPFYLKQAYKDKLLGRKLLTPFLNFGNGFDKEEEKFISLAAEMGKTPEEGRKSFRAALIKQQEFSEELRSIGRDFIKYLEQNPNEYAIVIVGRPYNSFTDLANKGIPKKFASRGVYTIPFDMLDYGDELVDDNQYWESGKKILKAAKIIQRHNQLFATYVSNFSCGPDSMLLTTFRSIMGTKPSLTLELDGHTADAGINTRIDAALDITNNFIKISDKIFEKPDQPFQQANIIFENNQGFFIGSDGEKVSLKDKSVDILIPSMGDLAAPMFAAALKSIGFNAIALPEGNQEILKYGRANTTGKECLPLLLCVGSMIDYIENRWDGKQYIAFFIVQGAGNCRLGQYPVFMREVIRRKKLPNVATLTLMNEDGFAGLGPNFAMRGIQAIIASDVLDDIRSAIMAHAEDPAVGLDIFNSSFRKLCSSYETMPEKFYRELKQFADIIKAKVPDKIKISEAKYIALCGEIYVRRDHFSHKWLNRQFAEKGFILKDAYISEWIFYVDYLLKQKLLEPESKLSKKIERNIRFYYMRLAEHRIKKILEKTGYYKFHKTEIEPLLEHSKHIIPMEYKGEPGLTLGTALHESIEKYCGIVNLGPFGCMPTRFTEAVSVPEMKIENKIFAGKIIDSNYSLPKIFNPKMNIPFLTIETDGNAYPQVIEARLETFLLQAEKTARLMKESRLNGYDNHKNNLKK